MKDFLTTDSRQYIPTKGLLKDLALSISQGIETAVHRLLESARTDGSEEPRVMSSLRNVPRFCIICRTIFPDESDHDLLQNLRADRLTDPLSLSGFLRAFASAAINDWVFEGQYDPMPTGPTENTWSKSLEGCMKEGQYQANTSEIPS